MFHEQVVVVLCDSNKKPLREFESQKTDNGRKAKVIVPFHSEYQFLIKNNSDRRIIIRAEIDGTNITKDGLIISAFGNSYLERFLDINKKFMFVPAGSSEVADPTNKENGVIKVRVRKEKKIDPPQVIEHHYHHYGNNGYRSPNYWIGSSVLRGCSSRRVKEQQTYKGIEPDIQPTLYTCNSLSLNDTIGVSSVNASFDLPLSAGATVEGGVSSQTFTSTSWNGDENEETVFTFHLLGSDNAERERKMQEYLKLKSELGI